MRMQMLLRVEDTNVAVAASNDFVTFRLNGYNANINTVSSNVEARNIQLKR